MKRILLVGVLLLLGCSSSFSQIYRAQEYYADEKLLHRQSFSRWEISAGVVGSLTELRDFVDQSLAKGEIGAELRVLYGVWDWFALGVGASLARPIKTAESLDSYQSRYLEGLGKVTLTPQTSPRSYLLIGGGVLYREVDYFEDWTDSSSSPYLTFGWGIETDIGSLWFCGLELRGNYLLTSPSNTYFYFSTRWEAAVHLRTGLRF